MHFKYILRLAVSAALLCLALMGRANAVLRDPNGVNVNTNGPTTVFITFGAITATQIPGEAIWCGELVAATFPETGNRCVAGTIFGRLPFRFNKSVTQRGGVLTDIMALPASVSRRAVQAARSGGTSSFFYVRKFLDTTGGGAHEYVTVTCRLAGGGSRVPLSFNDVKLRFKGKRDVFVYRAKRGEKLPRVEAKFLYNGTGRLRGRWEVAFPGEQKPTERDLQTEGSLTTAERSDVQRFTVVSRFNVFLPPTGEYTLNGPRRSKFPTGVDGQHTILLRIEVSDDKESDVNLGKVGGAGIEHHGGVSAFSMPTLRYAVGVSADNTRDPVPLALTEPMQNAAVERGVPITFRWSPQEGAEVYRLMVRDEAGRSLFSSFLRAGTVSYAAPARLNGRLLDGLLRWRVTALDANGTILARSVWGAVDVGD